MSGLETLELRLGAGEFNEGASAPLFDEVEGAGLAGVGGISRCQPAAGRGSRIKLPLNKYYD